MPRQQRQYDLHVIMRRKAQELARKIADQVQRNAGRGVQKAAIFLAARWKETVSIPAPRKRVVSRLGDFYYRATVRAVPGAPARKLSGRYRQSITYAMFGKSAVVGAKARSPKGFNYPKHLEVSGHPSLMPTVRKYRQELRKIVGRYTKVRGV